MALLLNWRVWVAIGLAVILATTNAFSYRKGKANVKAEWVLSVAEANAESLRLERARQSRADDAARIAAATSHRILADAANARSELGGLRGDLDAIQRASAQSLDAATKSVAALSDVFQQCSRSYQELAEVADRHANDSMTLQQAWPK